MPALPAVPPAPRSPDARTAGLADAALTGGFWGHMAALHRGPSLAHQWEQLDVTGAVDAFAVVAGRHEGYRAAHFTSDSDVYKWLDAAARLQGSGPLPPDAAERFDALVGLVADAQEDDGYLNTWIQAFFPDGRWQDLELEHEHYCLGHLIEAGVSLFEATGSRALLDPAVRAADLLVREFRDAPAEQVDGHEEIELALVRLARTTGEPTYLELARRFVERRGTATRVRRRFLASALRTASRYVRRAQAERRHRRAHPGWTPPPIPAPLELRPPWRLHAKVALDAFSGVEFQTDRPVRAQIEPTGHAVRWTYLQTAAAMLARDLGDPTLERSTLAAWDRLVADHLFVSGGAGALPLVEGFGAPGELDPELAYAETCAAIAGIPWNRELGLLTGEARHDDLLEWQLLNAVGVGMAVDGCAYAYDNPLQAPPGWARRPWFLIPCCPSNLSRTWASLATLQWSRTEGELRLHQLFSSRVALDGALLEVTGDLPWSGAIEVRASWPDDRSRPEVLAFRVPSWAGAPTVTVDGEPVGAVLDDRPRPRTTASGIDPTQAVWARVPVPARSSCTIRVDLPMPVRALRQAASVPKVGGKVALARGPLLFCLDGVDHPGLADRLTEVVLAGDLGAIGAIDVRPAPDLLEGAVALHARSAGGDELRFVPYFLWGNRGAEGMTPFVRLSS